jgi:transposase, IS30 family
MFCEHVKVFGGNVTRNPLTLADREEISRGLACGLTNKEIAASIERRESVISEEINRHGGRVRYRAHAAHAEAAESRKRPKARKIDTDPELEKRVKNDLRKGWSPEQISGRLACERRRGETRLSISHESVYTWFYAQAKGKLREEGIELRTKRENRKPRGRKKTPGAKIVGMRLIDERPAEVAGRQVPGHWEGDLVIGKGGKSAMGTLVERVSRFLVPVVLPDGHDAASVRCAVFDAVKDLPAHMRGSLTWDQGTEMAQHAALTLQADMPVYFAHAHSPWERGTNENTNGLIREYLPKGTEIPGDLQYLWAIADELNDRPRATLGFRKPSEVFAELLLQEADSASGSIPPTD